MICMFFTVFFTTILKNLMVVSSYRVRSLIFKIYFFFPKHSKGASSFLLEIKELDVLACFREFCCMSDVWSA